MVLSQLFWGIPHLVLSKGGLIVSSENKFQNSFCQEGLQPAEK